MYSDTIDSVVIPAADGEVGILPGHIPLLTPVDHGELRVTKDGQRQLNLAVSGGFAQVSGDRVSVLADFAIEEEKIDEHAVEAALKRAEDDLKGASLEPAEIERLEGVVRFSVAQLGIKRRPALTRPGSSAIAVAEGFVRRHARPHHNQRAAPRARTRSACRPAAPAPRPHNRARAGRRAPVRPGPPRHYRRRSPAARSRIFPSSAPQVPSRGVGRLFGIGAVVGKNVLKPRLRAASAFI